MTRNIFFPIILLSLLSFSCNKNTFPDISGTWKTTCKSISDVSTDTDNPSSPNAVLTVKQDYSFTFYPDFTFSKEISQEFVSLVPISEKTQLPESEDLKSIINNTVTILGTYRISKNLLTLECNNLILKDGSEVDFIEYHNENPNIGEVIQESTIEYLSEQKFKLDELTFSKE